MPAWTSIGDFGVDNLPSYGGRGTQGYRPSNAVNTYSPGIVLGRTALDSDVYPDFQTAQPLAAGTTTPGVVGVVSPDWAGFDNAGTAASFISASSYTNVQGTSFIRAVVKGIAYVFVDQSGSGAVTITNGIQLVSSRTSAGYGQGVALATATARGALIGAANLPAAGIGSSLTAASLAQATQTFTVAGTPASGDVLTTVLQVPYTDNQPGTVQTHSLVVTLNSTTAASVTTAAAAIVAAGNADSVLSPFYTFTNSAGVVTVTVNALSSPFLVTGGTTTLAGTALENFRFYTHVSGMVANSLTTTASVSSGSGSTYTAGGATFSGGTGFKGKVPALIYGAY